jgi:hypothetical protein
MFAPFKKISFLRWCHTSATSAKFQQQVMYDKKIRASIPEHRQIALTVMKNYINILNN